MKSREVDSGNGRIKKKKNQPNNHVHTWNSDTEDIRGKKTVSNEKH